jgi:ABC-2 type transport system permease protein
MSFLNRVGALARRDLSIELTYQFQLGLRTVSVFSGMIVYFFLGELIGESSALAAYEGGYFEWVLIGLIVLNFSQVSVRTFGSSIREAQNNGAFEILLATPTSLAALMLGTFMVPLLFATIDVALYVIIGWVLIGLSLPVDGILLSVVILILTVGSFLAIGLLSAAVIVLTKRGDPFATIVLQLTLILAGALFPITLLPAWAQTISHLIPAFYGLTGIRDVLLAGAGLVDVADEILILVAFDAVLLPLGLATLAYAVRLARVTGTLGNR